MAYSRHHLDTNHPELVAALLQLGMTVLSLASLGKGVPDLLVGWRGINLLVEVKRPGARTKPETAQKQAHFAATWSGLPVCRAESLQDVLRAFAVAA